MATDYTHAVAGLGLACLCATRPMPWTYWALAAALPILPDLDVFSTAAYGDLLGHRGFTHSLVFALVVGNLAACLTFRRLRTRWWRLSVVYFIILASHDLLDAMTRGGEGIPFFWPAGGRYGNWGPLPVSDLSFDLPDPRRSRALRAEMLWVWMPTLILASLVTMYRRVRQSPRTS